MNIFTFKTRQLVCLLFFVVLGYFQGMAQMVFSNATVQQVATGVVPTGLTNQPVVRLLINTTGVGTNLTVDEISFNISNTTAASITAANIYYTNTTTFSPAVQFGTTVSNPTGTHIVNGSVNLFSAATTHYFWIAYDIDGDASQCGPVDAEITSFHFSGEGSNRTPTLTNPAGAGYVQLDYCRPTLSNCSNGGSECITNFQLGSINSSSGALVGTCYSDYFCDNTRTTIVNPGGTYPFSLTYPFLSGYNYYVNIWCDLNEDGDFLDGGENLFSQNITSRPAGGVFNSATIAIPTGTTPGDKRLRVRIQYNVGSPGPASCANLSGYGETEDYKITVSAGCSAPGTQASTVTAESIASTSATINWTRGNGDGVIVIVRAGAPVNFDPQMGVDYNVDPAFGTVGTNVGTGNYAVYKGSGTSVAVTGLQQNVTYYVAVYEYNDAGLCYKYPPSTASFTTLDPMYYLNSTVEQVAGEVLGGQGMQPVVRLLINTAGSLMPLNVDAITFNISGTAIPSSIQQARLYYTTTAVFSTANPYGTAVVSPGGAHTVNASRQLATGANYFWLAYDLPTGILECSPVDGVIESFKLQSETMNTIPTVTNPAGVGNTLQYYCRPNTQQCNTGNDRISFFSINGQISNSSSSTGTGGGCYSDYFCNAPLTTTLNPGASYPFQITYPALASYNYWLSVWCDFNDDGDFDDSNEVLFSQNVTSRPAGGAFSGTITLPAGITAGERRLRIRATYNVASQTGPCANLPSGWGETEDYKVTISSECTAPTTQATSFSTSAVTSNTATISWNRGTGDGVIVVMRQGSAVNSDPQMGTSYTANPIFGSAGTLVGSGNYVVYVGSGTSVNVSGLLQNTTYHVAIYEYDASVPCYKYPALVSSFTTADPMIFSNSTVEQIAGTGAGSTFVNSYIGNNNQQVVRLVVNTLGNMTPLVVDQLSFSTGGTTDESYISEAKIFYTTTPAFAATNQFGSAVVSPSGLHTISGSQQLQSGANYFWLVYDISASAAECSVMDGQFPSFHIQGEGSNRIPTVSNPSGAGNTIQYYCRPASGSCNTSNERITLFTLHTLSSSSSISTGCYSDYYCDGARTTELIPGATYPFTVTYPSFSGSWDYRLRIWCDLNDDGDFNDPGEVLFTSPSSIMGYSGGVYPGTLSIPAGTSAGEKRLRVRVSYTNTNIDPCADYLSGNFAYSETEDYKITISNDCTAPATQASSFSTGTVNTTSAIINWTRGSGDGVIVVMRQGSAVNSDPQMGTSYTANPFFGTAGTSIGSGNYVVYIGSGTSVNVTGLLQNTTYHVAIYEYDASIPCYKYPALSSSFITANPMVYSSSTVEQIAGTGAGSSYMNSYIGYNDQPIVRLVVNTIGTTSALNIDQISFNPAGTLDLSFINQARVYYTSTAVFSTSNLFGSAMVTSTGVHTINGSQQLQGGANYFWLVYDVSPSASECSAMDAQIPSFHIQGEGSDRIPTVVSPAGVGNTIQYYCRPTSGLCNTSSERITLFTLHTLSSSTSVSSGCYSDYYCDGTRTTELTPGASYPFTVTFPNFSGNWDYRLRIWCDFNDDGDFTDSGELLFTSPSSIMGYSGGVYPGNLTIPAGVTPGDKRLRIRVSYTNPDIDPCADYLSGSFAYSETEDYKVTVSNDCTAPATQASSFTPGTIAVNTASISWIRGSGDGVVVVMRAGAPVNMDPEMGQIYTGNALFGAGSQIGTGNYVVYSGTGNSVNISGLLQNTAYHIAIYEYSTGAMCYKYPPLTGIITTNNPMQYANSTVEQVAGSVYMGAVNQPIVRLVVNTIGSDSPLNIQQIAFNITGTSASAVAGAKIFYSTSPTFSPAVQFGTTVVSPTGAHTISGSQVLASGANYFWLCYDINENAEQCTAADAQITSLKILTEASTRVPTVVNPPGVGNIFRQYCIPTSSGCSSGNESITKFSLQTISNTSTVQTGCYSDYYCMSGITPVLTPGVSYPFSITYGYFSGNYDYRLRIWCDLNDDGDFNDAGEVLFTSGALGNLPGGIYNGSLTIPTGTAPGNKRLRVRVSYTNTNIDPCAAYSGTFGYGETEDYKIGVSADCAGPAVPASNIISNVSGTSVTLNWTRGNGNGVVVVMRREGPVNSNPDQGVTYTANSTFGLGSQTGPDNYVVYTGTGTGVTITGILSTVTYHVAVYEYLNTPNGPCYAETGAISSFADCAMNPGAIITRWNGSVDNNWNNPGNWSHGVPVPCTDVIIQAGAPHYPTLSGDIGNLHNMTFEPGTSLNITEGTTLFVYNDWTSTNTTISGKGTVEFVSNNAVINGHGSFYNLAFNANTSISVGPAHRVDIRGALQAKGGTFNTNNNLRLVSDASSTGLIDDFSAGFNGQVSGKMQVQRFLPGSRRGYRYLASPVKQSEDLRVTDFGPFITGADNVIYNPYNMSATNFPTCWIYNEDDPRENSQFGWVSKTTSQTAIETMRGYAVIAPGNTTVELFGEVNTGTVGPWQITNTPSPNPLSDGFNLLGNPFPSPIGWNQFRAANPGATSNNVKCWANTGVYSGQYTDYNGLIGINGGNNNIALGQGFMVQRTGNGSANLSFGPEIRIANPEAVFFEEQPIENLLRMQISGGSGNDEAAIHFEPRAVPGFDDYDALKMMINSNGLPNISSGDIELGLSINSMGAFTSDHIIPLMVNITAAGTYTIRFTELESFHPLTMIYFEDRVRGEFSNLRLHSVVSIPGLSNGLIKNRFYIHFQVPPSIEYVDESCAGNDGNISVNIQNRSAWVLNVFTSEGNLVETMQSDTGGTFVFNGLTGGEYRVEFRKDDGYIASIPMIISSGASYNGEIEVPDGQAMEAGSPVIFISGVHDFNASYSWSFGDGTYVSEGNAREEHTYTEAGIYEVELLVSNGECSSLSTRQVIIVPAEHTSIRNRDSESFSLYPNPANTIVWIKLSGAYSRSIERLEILDATGRLVYLASVGNIPEEGQISLPVSELPDGLYQVCISGDFGRTSKLFAIQR